MVKHTHTQKGQVFKNTQKKSFFQKYNFILNCIRSSFFKNTKIISCLKNTIHGMFYFFSIHFEFNNHFIKSMRIWPIFL